MSLEQLSTFFGKRVETSFRCFKCKRILYLSAFQFFIDDLIISCKCNHRYAFGTSEINGKLFIDIEDAIEE